MRKNELTLATVLRSGRSEDSRTPATLICISITLLRRVSEGYLLDSLEGALSHCCMLEGKTRCTWCQKARLDANIYDTKHKLRFLNFN